MRSRSFRRALLTGGVAGAGLLAAFLLLRPAEQAPTPPPPPGFNPADFVKARPPLDAPYVVTDNDVVDAMLAIARVRPEDEVIDLGSGDGRILIAAARSHGARGLGVDIDPVRIRESSANAQAAGVSHRVAFRQEDLFRTPLRDADVLTLYLSREINLRLRPRILAEMRPGARVVSHDFDMGDWRYDQRQNVGTASVYLWIVPARVAGNWRLRSDGQSATLELRQAAQQLEGTITTADGTAVRVEQGRVAGTAIRFIAHIGGRRRVFEGRVDGDRMTSTVPTARWQAARTG